MKKYTVYFEVFGHKLKHVVYATCEEQARDLIKAKIYFHKVEQGRAKSKEDAAFERLKDILNIINKNV